MIMNYHYHMSTMKTPPFALRVLVLAHTAATPIDKSTTKESSRFRTNLSIRLA